MFSGVGCFSIIIAKYNQTVKVVSIDINSDAISYTKENIKANRVYCKVFPVLADSKDAIRESLQGIADRVLMPLPEKAIDYLPYAILALKPAGGWIHLYDFVHVTSREDPVEKSKLKVSVKLDSLNVVFSFPFSRVVRSTGPNWYQTVLDIKIGN